MNLVLPDDPTVAAGFILGWRRSPGSAAVAGNAEQTATVVVKRAWTVTPADDPADGVLDPINAPAIVEADVIAADVVTYESDLAAWKPEGDIIVVAGAGPIPLTVALNGTVRMSQPIATATLAGLAWEPKVDTPREAEAGTLDPAPEGQLPPDFDNRYFNGYARAHRVGGAIPHLAPDDEVTLTRAGNDVYAFTMPASRPVVRHEWFAGNGVDDPSLWRARDVAMALDTLVIEPAGNLATTVWRAVWPAAFDPGDGSGPVSLGNNRQLTVRLVEG